MKKIIYIVNDLTFFLSYCTEVAQKLVEEGYEIHVAAPRTKKETRLRELGFDFHEIPLLRKNLNPIHEFSTFKALLQLYRQLKPDLVHHLTIKPNLYGSIAARVAKVPSVVNTFPGLGHVYVNTTFKDKLVRLFAGFLTKLALQHNNSRSIFLNSDDLAFFLKNRWVGEHNSVKILSSGVDIHHYQFSTQRDGMPIVVLPARMLWTKGVGVFVDAVRILKEKKIDGRFALVGETDPDNPAGIPNEQLEAWNKEGIIEWWGWREDMRAVYEEAHIVCLPSMYREGVPTVLLEGAACGRPIITTDAPGCREAVNHNINGILVPKDDPEALADAMQKLIEDASLRGLMGEAGRKLIEQKFSRTQVVAETLRVYHSLG